MYGRTERTQMKKFTTITCRLLCLALALLLVGCSGNDEQTSASTDGADTSSAATEAEQTEGEGEEVTEWVRPTYEELVETIMKEGKVVADFIRDNDFIYGHALLNPGINWRTLSVDEAIRPDERIVACDRLVCWVLFRAGFNDQNWFHGIDIDKYAEEHGFTRITNHRSCQAGDIVFVNPDANGNPGHVFICAGPNLRYDAGSDERINGSRGPQPFSEPILNFCYGWRPSPDYLPDPSMLDIYETPAEDVATVSENAEVYHSEPDSDDTITIKKTYNPYDDDYSAFEFHVKMSASNQGSDRNTWMAGYIGSRLVTMRDSASNYNGGVWIGIRGDDAAYLFLGTHSQADIWNERVATFRLPETTDTMHEYTVVDTGEVIKYYIKLSTGEQHMICAIHTSLEYDQIVVTDNEGNIVYAGECNIVDEGYFRIWNHGITINCEDIAIKSVKV